MVKPGAKVNGKGILELREQVALANRLLHHYGLTSYLGHASARIPGTDHIIIKGRPHVSMDRVRPQDLMIMDLEGNVVEASQEYSARVGEWPIHTEVYKARPDVGSVVHTHQKWCTIFGIAGRPVLPVQHPPTAAVAAEHWPVYEETFGLITDVVLGGAVARVMGRNVACHLRTHGMIFVGLNVERAVLAAADAEHLAEMTWRAMPIGTPVPMPMEYMRDDVEKRFTLAEEDVRDGVARGEWANHEWVDQNPDAAWSRGIQL